MKQVLKEGVQKVLFDMGFQDTEVAFDYPSTPDHGEFSTNIAMIIGKNVKKNPITVAGEIVARLKNKSISHVSSIEIAGPGFINFKMEPGYFFDSIVGRSTGTSKPVISTGSPIMVEYTDPNPFKIFHIGHLMANAIGESVARLFEKGGYKVIRACYQGDVGLHVAKTIWAIMNKDKKTSVDMSSMKGAVVEKVKWLGDMYVTGSQCEDDPAVKKEMAVINMKIFDRSDQEINAIYDMGRKWSLDYFEGIYSLLGTKFDKYFFESEVVHDGLRVVDKFAKSGVFEKSDGAIVYKGEKDGLHTRVFVTSQGIPTYETKELGLNTLKFELYPDLSKSIIITANEQDDYFRVLRKVLSVINTKVGEKTLHISHGMMRFRDGKMSSRKGNIISAEELIGDIKNMVMKKVADRDWSDTEKDQVSETVAIAAIKYTILRQSVGGDVIFDSAKSISFEGDSGPYLQYTAVRARSVLKKAESMNVQATPISKYPSQVHDVERLISRFDDITNRTINELSPQLIANYLINLCGAYNNYYSMHTIIDDSEGLSSYRLALTRKFYEIVESGLDILGIKVPHKM